MKCSVENCNGITFRKIMGSHVYFICPKCGHREVSPDLAPDSTDSIEAYHERNNVP